MVVLINIEFQPQPSSFQGAPEVQTSIGVPSRFWTNVGEYLMPKGVGSPQTTTLLSGRIIILLWKPPWYLVAWVSKHSWLFKIEIVNWIMLQVSTRSSSVLVWEVIPFFDTTNQVISHPDYTTQKGSYLKKKQLLYNNFLNMKKIIYWFTIN